MRCDVLDFPENGLVDQQGNEVGSTAIYSCIPGFLLTGDNIRTCLISGEWSGDPPTCDRKSLTHNPVLCHFEYHAKVVEFDIALFFSFLPSLPHSLPLSFSLPSFSISHTAVDCGDLPQIAFGRVTFTTTTFRSQASYTCQEGYVLMGNFIRTCQNDGTWSGEDPTCQS